MRWLWHVVAAACIGTAHAGYLSVDMSDAYQCAPATVSWSGDNGPFHLLLTPTTFVSHGYNVWIPTIEGSDNETNTYQLPIDQPAGLQFMVTVWGASGIEYAGTTDVLSDTSCFMSDKAINTLYTFAFNITNPNPYPPQCSNMTITWPTSLESNITSTRKRSVSEKSTDSSDVGRQADADLTRDIADLQTNSQLDDMSSSNKSSGNTTVPPTMFGIIPLGNSFALPITYSPNSKFASGLPSSSVSKTPTTSTAKGITHLNWTVSLAKGTRFILVAGIGSLEEWASGGSSEMMTVGQGGTSCPSNTNGATPSVTANSTSPTASPDIGGSGQSGPSSTGIILACVFSGVGTFVLCVLLWFCCRICKHRNRAASQGLSKPSVMYLATFGKLDTKHGPNRNITRYSPSHGPAETQLDLINSREDSERGTPCGTTRNLPHIVTSPVGRPISAFSNMEQPSPTSSTGYRRPISAFSGMGDHPSPTSSLDYRSPRPISAVSGLDHSSPTSSADLRELGAYPHQQPSSMSTRRTTMYEEPPYSYQYATSPLSSPVNPNQSLDRIPDLRHDFMGRQASVDGLVAYPPLAHTPAEITTTVPRRPPLTLHDPSAIDDYSDDEGAETLPENLAAYKRETLAYLGSAPPSPTSATPLAGPSRRRRQSHDPHEPAEYVVHRDAGRVSRSGGATAARRVLELPPRYEELMWDEDDDLGGLRTGESTPLTPATPVSATGSTAPFNSANAGANANVRSTPNPPADGT